MSTNQQRLTKVTQGSSEIETVVLKTNIRAKTRRELHARASLDGTKLEVVVEAALEQYLRAPVPIDEQLGQLLKLRLPRPLYDAVDVLRSANRTDWTSLVRDALVQATQKPAPKPVLTVPRATLRPTVSPGYIPGTTVTSVDGGWDSESDSGVRTAANQ